RARPRRLPARGGCGEPRGLSQRGPAEHGRTLSEKGEASETAVYGKLIAWTRAATSPRLGGDVARPCPSRPRRLRFCRQAATRCGSPKQSLISQMASPRTAGVSNVVATAPSFLLRRSLSQSLPRQFVFGFGSRPSIARIVDRPHPAVSAM